MRTTLRHAVATSQLLRVGGWLVDPRADELSADDRIVKLEPVRMRLLLALAARPQEVVLTEELLDAVWRGVVVAPNSVYQAVSQLRRAIGPEVRIETVSRKGYRLRAAVLWPAQR